MKNLVIVIPVHNEEKIIRKNISTILSYLKRQKMSVDWKVIIGENGSTDKTIEILRKIPKNNNLSFLSLKARSRDQAIIKAWSKINADYYMFMDADLATDIRHIPDLINGLEQGYDIVIGSRRLPGSKVNRLLIRRIVSSIFHKLMKVIFNLKINDLQCGFKAINKNTRNKIIPKIKYGHDGFMDTELLVLASEKKLKIKEIPVKWYDKRDSRFTIRRTIFSVLINSFRIKRDLFMGRYE